ncbi:MAG: hypothetical protein HC851_10695 [Acaryochloris sp. RU_4_1]|nr:hypothetical protein [Acaryochloris sp. RU_4_1]
MPSFDARKPEGFTLIEMAIIAMIIGILSAIALPSFLSFLNARRVDQALDDLESALKQIQLEAVRRSRNCNINISTGNNPTITGRTGTYDCLRIGREPLDGINLTSSVATNPLTITFDFKGRPNTTTTTTIVLSLASGEGSARCLVLAPGIGTSRTGNYNGTGTVASNCITPQL